MMKDVLLFLMTFAVIMLAFACGVSYIFNMAVGEFTTLKIRNVSKTTFENARHFKKTAQFIYSHFIFLVCFGSLKSRQHEIFIPFPMHAVMSLALF